MTSVTALHVAARRFCIDHARMWEIRYGEEREQREAEGRYPRWGYRLLEEDYAVFPRYHVLHAILWEVERIEIGDVATTSQLRDLLLAAGRTAHSMFTRPRNEPAAIQAMDEERARFCAYVAGLSESVLAGIELLPYRRVLCLAESERLWSGLAERWSVDGGIWHPLIADDLPAGILAFQEAWFRKSVPAHVLRQVLAERGIDRLWELREGGSDQGQPEYEIDLTFLEPTYDGRCGFWTSGNMDWLIYVSYESSITVAGDWLLDAVTSAWPTWQEHLYTGWDYEGPPE